MNKALTLAALLLACLPAATATGANVAAAVPAAPVPVAPPLSVSMGGQDPLFDALTCRAGAEIAGLLPRLRRERPDDFVQTERQYSDPAMDLYRLHAPIHAWGHTSDAIVLTHNRVLMLVPGNVEDVARTLEATLARTDLPPLSGLLDEQHALVLYTEDRPGLRQRVLMGCEYRLASLSLLDDPDLLWRNTPSPDQNRP